MAYNIAQTEQYIRSAAKARGIDPDVAVRVAKSEGLAKGVYQSNLSRGAEREPSYGPFQLLVGGEGTSFPKGLGNDFMAQTGLDPSDPSTVPRQVDFALDNASKNGWGAWYGAKAAGIGSRDGIGGTPSSTAPIADSGGETTLYGGTGADTLANPMPQNGGLGGLGGFLDSGNGGDLMQALGYSLMASPHNAPLSGLGEFLPAIQDRREKKDLLAQATAKENRTLSYLRQSFPDIAAQVDAGLPVSEAFKLAQTERLAQAKGPEYTATQRDFLYAQQHPEYLDFLNKSGNGAVPTATREIEDRARLAPQYGLKPDSAEGKAFILTGKLPSSERNVTADDRKAIREADDMVFSADQAAETLGTAKTLSDGAYEGATAGTRAAIGNNLPDWMVPDIIASPEASATTSRLNQAVTEGALQQMKSIFGGNPTEGERAILLEIQGSANQPKAVREEIYKRAAAAVERRKKFNEERAGELRGNTYYDIPPEAPAGAGTAAAPVLTPTSDDPLGLRR